MKGIETFTNTFPSGITIGGSDHCPAMKGIETFGITLDLLDLLSGSDHCPAMKGIETRRPAPPPR